MNKNWLISLVAVAVILALPSVLTTYGVRLAGELFIMSIFALSLGLIMGYAGLVSFGHVAFFGTGVYSVAIISQYVTNTYVLLLAAIIISGLLAWISGLLFLRIKGSYFLMLTLAFNQLIYVFFYKTKKLAGGADGMAIDVSPNFGFGSISGPIGLYYLMAIAFILCFIMLYYFIQSPTGRVVMGAKENDSRMKALGYNTGRYKLLTYTISGMIGGLGGGLYAYFNHFASPEITSWMLSGQALIMVIIGGAGTLIGPPIGAAIFVVLQSYISSYTDRWPIIMGVIFLSLVFIGRGGLAHLLISIWNKITLSGSKIDDENRKTSFSKPTVTEIKGSGGKQQ